ncbi:MAG TPA: C-GCAxxG-C-C family protein [Bacteroidales bacterium]|nr:C-GCAxxG-C-C family protein [Bacteroidales bacterium]
MDKQQQAICYFRDHFNCAQAVFTVFGKENGLTEDQCLKVACGFGAGIGRQQNICGALSGAVMAIGLKYGKAAGDGEEKKSDTYSRTRELFKEFTGLNGSSCCRELLNGFDINNPADYEEIIRLKLFQINCEKYVNDAVLITEKLLK